MYEANILDKKRYDMYYKFSGNSLSKTGRFGKSHVYNKEKIQQELARLRCTLELKASKGAFYMLSKLGY